MVISANLKAVLLAVATVVAVGVQYVVTGEFDKAELATTLTGLIGAILVYFTPNKPA